MRTVSTVAPQSLTMLNDTFVAGEAQHFAERLISAFPGDLRAQIAGGAWADVDILDRLEPADIIVPVHDRHDERLGDGDRGWRRRLRDGPALVNVSGEQAFANKPPQGRQIGTVGRRIKTYLQLQRAVAACEGCLRGAL